MSLVKKLYDNSATIHDVISSSKIFVPLFQGYRRNGGPSHALFIAEAGRYNGDSVGIIIETGLIAEYSGQIGDILDFDMRYIGKDIPNLHVTGNSIGNMIQGTMRSDGVLYDLIASKNSSLTDFNTALNRYIRKSRR